MEALPVINNNDRFSTHIKNNIFYKSKILFLSKNKYSFKFHAHFELLRYLVVSICKKFFGFFEIPTFLFTYVYYMTTPLGSTHKHYKKTT